MWNGSTKCLQTGELNLLISNVQILHSLNSAHMQSQTDKKETGSKCS